MRWFVKVLGLLVVVLILGGLGTAVYHAGFATGLAQAGAAAGAAAGAVPMQPGPYGPYGWHPYWGHPYGFHPFGFLGGLLVVFLIFGLLRAAFWGRWRYGYLRGGGGRGPARWEDHMRAIHDEWHRSAPQGPSPETPTRS